MKTIAFPLLALVSVALISGCCSTRQCINTDLSTFDKSSVNTLINARKSEGLVDQDGNSIAGSIVERLNTRAKTLRLSASAPMEIRMLALSGGGPKGAYGVGFIDGLRALSLLKDYDVITGISTGALQATFIFLGSDDTTHYSSLKALYTEEEWDRIIPPNSAIQVGLFCRSLRNAEQFLKKASEYITDDMIDRVAEIGSSQNKSLYIGTVNLDTGLFQIWDMVDIAENKEYELYRSIVMASAAIPVILPPVELPANYKDTDHIGKHLHIDGGARHLGFVNATSRLMKDVVAILNRTRPTDPSIDFLVNSTTYVDQQCAQAKVLDVGIRSIDLLLSQGAQNDVFRAYIVACANGIEFRMTEITPEMTRLKASFYPGMRDDMKALYRDGVIRARTKGWEPFPEDSENWQEAAKLCGQTQ